VRVIEDFRPEIQKGIQAIVDPRLVSAKTDDKFQFERHGYFVADRVDHLREKPVFNLAVGLKDGWGK
jgi:glutaminyl-tRNA synthetase